MKTEIRKLIKQTEAELAEATQKSDDLYKLVLEFKNGLEPIEKDWLAEFTKRDALRLRVKMLRELAGAVDAELAKSVGAECAGEAAQPEVQEVTHE